VVFNQRQQRVEDLWFEGERLAIAQQYPRQQVDAEWAEFVEADRVAGHGDLQKFLSVSERHSEPFPTNFRRNRIV
jgi:hypothetical protein